MNGSSLCSGTVEVRLGQSWEPACGALWDGGAAEAVCLALGCGGAGPAGHRAPPTAELPPGPGAGNASGAANSTQALAPAVQCTGAEWRLCEVVEHACSSNWRAVELTCAGRALCSARTTWAPAAPAPRPSATAPHTWSPALATRPKPRPKDFHLHPPQRKHGWFPRQTEDGCTASCPALSVSSDLPPDLQFAGLVPNPTQWVPSPNWVSSPYLPVPPPSFGPLSRS